MKSLRPTLEVSTGDSTSREDGVAGQRLSSEAQSFIEVTENHDPGTSTNTMNERVRTILPQYEHPTAEQAARKGKAIAAKEPPRDTNPEKVQQMKYAQQQIKKKQEAKSDRERILRQIENDKLERIEKEKQRKAAVAANNSDINTPHQHNVELKQVNSMECAIQVRQFDGSTIRSKFTSGQTLLNVRYWIDNQRRDGDAPYTFRQILAPMPNRPLTISEEAESLQSLSLTPSATLIMVPIRSGYTTAYEAESGYISGALNTSVRIVSGGVGLIRSSIGSLLGYGQSSITPPPPPPPSQLMQGVENPSHGTRSRNMRTLNDQRAQSENHEFYNGNQVRATILVVFDMLTIFLA